MFKLGYETIAIDMPTYGMTEVRKDQLIRYDDWVALALDYIKEEKAKDDRPIFLYGLSAGGMETYHVAEQTNEISGIIGMTFLDQRYQKVRDDTAYNIVISRIGIPSVKFLNDIKLKKN